MIYDLAKKIVLYLSRTAPQRTVDVLVREIYYGRKVFFISFLDLIDPSILSVLYSHNSSILGGS